MNCRFLITVAAASALVVPLHLASVASAEPAFGPGNWTLRQTGADAQFVTDWNAVADCGADCLTVEGGDMSTTFNKQLDGTWTGNWRVVDGDCYDTDGNVLAATATWTSSFVVNPDLSVNHHVVDEVGCDGKPGAYDETYELVPAGAGSHSGGDRTTP